MRFIGRVRRLASPSKVAVIRDSPATAPNGPSGQPVPELPNRAGAAQAARSRRRPTPVNAPRATAHALDRAPSARIALPVVEHVFAFEHPDTRVSPDRGKRAEDEGAVRDRFVAGQLARGP
jgi:hypothetical protein